MTSETGRDSVADTFVGAILDGRYRIDGLIGRGGMAAVYRADDLVLGRRVAVKVFGASAEGIDDADRRRSETALLASLTHPALVTLYDAAKDEATDREFLVMELVDGRDLREMLLAGPIPAADAADVLAELAEGLHVIHSRGIVHRDVKPANVLLSTAHLPTRRWNAKLADFGIARLLDESRLTSTGHIIGTPGYLSPEQVRGERVGSAADVYALGLVMIEALTGQQSFPGPALESASARLVRDPEIPASLGPHWCALLAAMTARDPAERPSALDVAVTAHTLAVEAREAAATSILSGDPVGDSDDGTRLLAAPMPVATGDGAPGDGTAGATRAGDDVVDATRVLPAQPTAATRLLTAPAALPGVAASAPPVRADATRASAPARRRMPRGLLPAGLGALALARVVMIVPTIASSVAGEPAPSETPLPSVPGELGTHLEQLEEAVTP